MQTIKKLSSTGLLKSIFMMGLCFGSSAISAETLANDHGQHAERPSAWPGIYYGLLPCSDCYGVKTSLALNANNNSYIKITQQTGKSQRDYVEKGKFSWGDKNNVITLTPTKGGTLSQQYKVADNALVQLDANGHPISGKEADKYVLHKTEMTNPQDSHSH
jgi:copper homeostasis protein (lipoprotein)